MAQRRPFSLARESSILLFAFCYFDARSCFHKGYALQKLGNVTFVRWYGFKVEEEKNLQTQYVT